MNAIQTQVHVAYVWAIIYPYCAVYDLHVAVSKNQARLMNIFIDLQVAIALLITKDMVILHLTRGNQEVNTNLRTFTGNSSTTQIFFILLLQSDNELPLTEMQKNWGVTDFVFEIKRVESYPNFDKPALVTRHGLSGC